LLLLERLIFPRELALSKEPVQTFLLQAEKDAQNRVLLVWLSILSIKHKSYI
jgi:hypothetical protein